jgi:hypothetical protein
VYFGVLDRQSSSITDLNFLQNNFHQEVDFNFADVDVTDMSGQLRKSLVLERFLFQQGIANLVVQGFGSLFLADFIEQGFRDVFLALHPRFSWDWLVLEFSGRSVPFHF